MHYFNALQLFNIMKFWLLQTVHLEFEIIHSDMVFQDWLSGTKYFEESFSCLCPYNGSEWCPKHHTNMHVFQNLLCSIEQSKSLKFWQLFVWILTKKKKKVIYTVLKVQILSVHTFPGNRTHDSDVASAMLYSLSNRMIKYS